ncbi:MAG: FtsW/RodA/SpoVE family cell cycle protein [Bacteroidales bacterium]
MDFIKSLFKGDKYIWGVYMVMVLISGIAMYSASSTLAYRASEYYRPAFSHLTHLIFGTILVLVVHNIPARILRGMGIIFYPLTILMLILVMMTPQVNGASRQMMGFQPSELAKFVTIAVVAALLAKGSQETGGIDKKKYYWILAVTTVPCLLILKENFSTGILLGAVIFSMMYLAKVQAKRLLILLGSIALGGILFVSVLMLVPSDKLPGRMPTWKARLERSGEDLVNEKINDKNRQAQFGHMAVANGGFIGKFPGNSQIRDFLPQAYSDFIYSIIIEEGGLIIGGCMVMFLYLFLLIRAGIIYRRCQPMFPKMLLIGVTLLIVYQALMSMAVGVGIFVTGQPLPLISRGGTSIMMTCIYFGVILSVSRINGDDEESDFISYREAKAIPENFPETAGSYEQTEPFPSKEKTGTDKGSLVEEEEEVTSSVDEIQNDSQKDLYPY